MKTSKQLLTKFFACTCILALLFTVTACGSSAKAQEGENIASATDIQEYFGTVMNITLYGKDQQMLNEVVADAFLEIQRLENIFSAKLSDSELSQLNSCAFESPTPVSEELFLVFSKAIAYNQLSEGALDISLGTMISLWGIGSESEGIPEEDQLKDFIAINGCQYIELNEVNKTICYHDSRIKVDLGAIAKGYAADRVKYLIQNRLPDAYGILNFGGNVMTIGSKSDGSDWVVGITDPLNPSEVCASISVSDLCVVTSGNYERYFEQDGIRYHHILDPNTGYPATNGIISSTIIGSSSMDCDALSTACFILGTDKALALIESIDDVEAVFYDDNGMVYKTSGIDALLFQNL